MTRFLILVLIALTSHSSCNGQTDDDEKKREEETLIALKKWFENPSITNHLLDPTTIKNLQDSGRVEAGFKEGLWNEYALDTTLMGQQTAFIVGDKKESITYSASLLKERGQYTKGKKTGIWTLYDSKNLNAPIHWIRKAIINYKDGLKHGEEIIYQGYEMKYQKPLIRRHWKNNVENGIGEIYNSNSPHNLQKRYKAADGQMWLLESYHPNGQLEIEYRDTLISGRRLKYFKEYFINSKLKRTGYYDESGEEQFGTWINYYENGRIESTSNYTAGRLNGIYKYFHDNGQLWTERIYKNGDLMEVVSNYTRNGKKNNPGTIRNGTGTLYVYDSDGQLLDKVEFVKGQEKEGSR